jgi:hypothetical protein
MAFAVPFGFATIVAQARAARSACQAVYGGTMVRQNASTLAPRSPAQLLDAEDLRSVISAALAATPIDEASLRRGVWTLVGMERDAGASPGYIIIALTDLVDMAPLTPASVKEARLRQVILWCVEAYFGHLGGEVLARDPELVARGPRRASNR